MDAEKEIAMMCRVICNEYGRNCEECTCNGDYFCMVRSDCERIYNAGWRYDQKLKEKREDDVQNQ